MRPLRAFLPFAALIAAFAARIPAAEPDYLSLVRGCAGALLEHGRDRYGPVHSPLFMAVIDVDRLEAVPPDGPILDGNVRTEGRLHRRNLGGSDLWEDQSLLRVLRRLSERTGDARYSAAGREYAAHFLEHCRKASNGMPAWGTHLFQDCFKDAPGGDGDGAGPHEILVREPAWDLLWEASPGRVREIIEGLWEWHVADKTTGLHNRHDDAAPGCDFAFSGSEFILAFAFLHAKTGEPAWLERSRLVARWHWNARNLETGLAPDAPGIRDRFDGQYCMTTVPGPHAGLVLRAHQANGDPFLREAGMGHVLAYARRGWDPRAKSYWGMLALDGTPQRDDEDECSPRLRRVEVYDDFRPSGHTDPWPTVMYSYEFPLIAAQACAHAAQIDPGNPELETAVRRWAEWIERELPPKTGRRWREPLRAALPELDEAGGAYAEHYARAIDFLFRASRLLAEPRFETKARETAAEAVAKLHHPPSGLFMGHAAKRTYEATDGVGYLLMALLDLERGEPSPVPEY